MPEKFLVPILSLLPPTTTPVLLSSSPGTYSFVPRHSMYSTRCVPSSSFFLFSSLNKQVSKISLSSLHTCSYFFVSHSFDAHSFLSFFLSSSRPIRARQSLLLLCHCTSWGMAAAMNTKHKRERERDKSDRGEGGEGGEGEDVQLQFYTHTHTHTDTAQENIQRERERDACEYMHSSILSRLLLRSSFPTVAASLLSRRGT